MKQIAIILLAMGLVASANAQELHSKAYLIHDHDALVPGINVGVHLDIESGWHAYWENPGDVGAPPEMQITSNVQILQSDLNYPIPLRIESNPYDSFGYHNEGLFYKTIHLAKDAGDPKSAHLEVQFDWLVCKEICVPCTKTFSLDLPIAENAKLDESHFKYFSYPQNTTGIVATLAYEANQSVITITSSKIKKSQSVDFFPSSTMREIFNKPTSKEIKDGVATFHYEHTKAASTDVTGLVKLSDNEAYWIGEHADSAIPSTTTHTKPDGAPHILYVFLLAFLGGLLLNLMPCVLPVVSLKLLSLMKSTHERRGEIRSSNLWFSAGICVSLVGFACIFLAFQSTGESLGWGFQLQSPTFVSCLIVLFFLIGLNLIGFFEVQNIPIPGLGRLLLPNSRASDFLSGFFTTVVATPCTAPFMAVAVGFALTQNSLIVVSTFLFLGLGLSFPFLLLSAFPTLIRFVPRPGNWMVSLKEFLSFPMFLTVAWLTWVLAQLTDDRATLSTLAALTLIVFFFWARKRIFNKLPLQKKIVLLLIAASVFLALKIPLIQKTGDGVSWEQFDQKKIESYAKSSIVLVDFTADWCLTCKTNERITFANEDVIAAIQANKVKMIKADWTRRNPEITKVLEQYGRAGVPFYLLYKPTLTTPMVLPTLLTPSIFIDAITGKGEQP